MDLDEYAEAKKRGPQLKWEKYNAETWATLSASDSLYRLAVTRLLGSPGKYRVAASRKGVGYFAVTCAASDPVDAMAICEARLQQQIEADLGPELAAALLKGKPQ